MRRFKWIPQRDAMQCGVASLAMICRWYGKGYSVAELERYCHPTNEGVSLKGIADAAAELGFKAHANKMDTETLKKAPLPLILHWNRNHFVVLYGISKNGKRFYVADPAKGKVTESGTHSELIELRDTFYNLVRNQLELGN